MFKNRMPVVCLVVACLLATLGFAGDGATHGAVTRQLQGEPPPPPAIDAVARFLNLSDDQLQMWRDLQWSRYEQMSQLAELIGELEERLETQLGASNPSPSAIGDLSIQLRRARKAKGSMIGDFTGQCRAILTPAQIERLEMVQEGTALSRWISPLTKTGFLAPPPPPPPPPPAPPAPDTHPAEVSILDMARPSWPSGGIVVSLESET